ncbi:hypothetical protein CBS101457_005274 [Exobasidium rhododendri]|nr:hypothetical protein CBS101457_005274 [Exobasidium rhododendri]
MAISAAPLPGRGSRRDKHAASSSSSSSPFAQTYEDSRQSTFGDAFNENRPWSNAHTMYHEPYQLIHFSKNKLGDKVVAQAYQNDRNLRHHSCVFTALNNVEGAHRDADHYAQHHAGMKARKMKYYATSNHLGRKEHHENSFLADHELGDGHQMSTRLQSLHDLPDDLHPNLPIVIHQTSPIELGHLDFVSDAAAKKKLPVVRAVLNHGHNSQQYGTPAEKIVREGEFLNHAAQRLQQKHPNAQVIWTSSKDSFQRTPNGAMNRGADELDDSIHPTHLEAGSRDTFHGPNVVENYKNLMQLKDAGHLPHNLVSPLPPNYRDTGKSAEEAIADMKSTYGKSDEDRSRIEEGRSYLNQHFTLAERAMAHAVHNPKVKEAHPELHRKIGKFLGRLEGPNVKPPFRHGNHALDVEFTDPLQTAGLRMAMNNYKYPDGPQMLPVKFVVGENGVGYRRVAPALGETHAGAGLSNVHPDEAAMNHRLQVTKSKIPAWF